MALHAFKKLEDQVEEWSTTFLHERSHWRQQLLTSTTPGWHSAYLLHDQGSKVYENYHDPICITFEDGRTSQGPRMTLETMRDVTPAPFSFYHYAYMAAFSTVRIKN